MTEKKDKQLRVIMGLIVNSGSAKSSAFEAINAAKKGEFDYSNKKLEEADQFLLKAHNAQTNLIKEEARGEHSQVTLLMVHAQDHIMNSITFRDLAGEIVDLYKNLANKE